MASSRHPLGASAPLLLAAVCVFVSGATAHDHGDDKIEHGEAASNDPIDAVLWIHILTQMLAFGILYPLGMVFGLIKSRWHVPVQVLATALTILGYVLGHAHGGRQFRSNNAHAVFATPLFFVLAAQVCIGIYLKLHLEKGINARIRRVVLPIHSVLGKAFPVLAWAQMVLGGITAMGFCQGNHTGQCAAHFIMGGAFIAYGIILTIMLVAGQLWLRRSGRSQEFYDSAVIAVWGCFNTFTEHRWGTDWVKNDWQHTTMGIVWWCAGLAGVFLSRDRDGNPKRNFVPGFVLLITGWAMSAHPQEVHTSAAVHAMFGYTLMAAGVTRVIEIAFVLRDRDGVSEDGREVNSFQYLPVFLLYASGFLFMGATEEQMQLVEYSAMDHVAYILILYSFAFLMFLFASTLITTYDRGIESRHKPSLVSGGDDGARSMEDRRLRDAEEFELDGLVSSDEEDRERNGFLKTGRPRASQSSAGSSSDLVR